MSHLKKQDGPVQKTEEWAHVMKEEQSTILGCAILFGPISYNFFTIGPQLLIFSRPKQQFMSSFSVSIGKW